MKIKKKFSFPTAYTVILIVMLIVMGLTYIIPSGKYSKLSYDTNSSKFIVDLPNGGTKEYQATQQTLDKLGVNVDLKQFTSGSISKPVAIPNTYEQLKKENTTIFGAITTFLKAPIQGLYDSIDIIAFVLVIGGLVGIINSTGAFTAGINALSKALKGKEKWMIVIIASLVALGGTTFGLAEETIAFYPIVVPIFIAAGYDAIVAIATIFLGSCIGTMVSTINPFSTVIASNIAGVTIADGLPLRILALVLGMVVTLIYIIRYGEKVKKDPTKSLIYFQKEEIENKFLSEENDEELVKFTFTKKLMLLIFGLSFVVMIYGIKELGWGFIEMTSLFFGVTFVMFPLTKQKESEFVSNFVQGAADLLGVALIIALARGVTIIMDGGLISDTLLHSLSGVVSNMSGVIFSVVMYFVYIVLGFFINSSSGLAVLSMPIMAPLADVVGVNRDIIITAYMFGQGLISIITPTGLILASLAMVDVTYDKWLKFVLPLVGIIMALSVAMLCIGSLI
ncbi:C4-dicarboxylate anaerobic carrier [uncultured Clostridium sp.]|nr:C4-dicarboxylate anaerobic carrier [uncultured Clostridium sp.]SCI94007.1 C4-dicarboxylate anaerobic carrier [uncultured Clostridium sp.]